MELWNSWNLISEKISYLLLAQAENDEQIKITNYILNPFPPAGQFFAPKII